MPRSPASVDVDINGCLDETENAAAQLFVDGDAIKPMAWLNKAHYDHLRSNNSLASDLTRRIEAYAECASGTAP